MADNDDYVKFDVLDENMTVIQSFCSPVVSYMSLDKTSLLTNVHLQTYNANSSMNITGVSINNGIVIMKHNDSTIFKFNNIKETIDDFEYTAIISCIKDTFRTTPIAIRGTRGITQSEYNTALDTADQILGEEV